MSDWKKGFPIDPGYYWLFSYRYGRDSMYGINEPELQLSRVVEIANGTILVADGQPVYKTEVEQPYYMPADLPVDLPILD